LNLSPKFSNMALIILDLVQKLRQRVKHIRLELNVGFVS
jgi:hypothetical protein